MNGAELIAQIDRMTMGWWRPSPGSIYPLLEQLEQEKLVQKNSEGRYELTEVARRGPSWIPGLFPGMNGPRTPEDAVRELEAYATYLEDLARGDPKRVRTVDDRLRSVAQRLESLTRPSSGPGGRN